MSYLEIHPARAKSSKRAVERAWKRPEFIIEEKIDGWRFLMHLGRDLDRVFMTGRRVSSETGLLSEKGLLVPQIWPNARHSLDYTVLDGEITVPGGFRSIAGVMNTDPDKAAQRIEELGVPTYHVFDVLWYDGIDVREYELRDRLTILRNTGGSLLSGALHLVPQVRAHRSVFDRIVADGGEGVILKDLLAPYGEGWFKVKRSHTLDVVVTGFTWARFGRTGKYVGQIGAVVVSVYTSSGELLEVGQVSGMTDSERINMTENRDDWLGTVIEIESQNFARYRLRHPRYKRRREDVDPKTATFTKMMHDLNLIDREWYNEQLSLNW